MKKKIETIDLYTDGSFKSKSKKGGYAAYLPHLESVICGSEENSSNNKMELQAVISGLKHIDENTKVRVFSDSQYVCRGINNKWINEWEKNGWKTRNDKDVKNRELWEELNKEIQKHKSVKAFWVKGHADNYNNNLCDAFANAATDLIK